MTGDEKSSFFFFFSRFIFHPKRRLERIYEKPEGEKKEGCFYFHNLLFPFPSHLRFLPLPPPLCTPFPLSPPLPFPFGGAKIRVSKLFSPLFEKKGLEGRKGALLAHLAMLRRMAAEKRQNRKSGKLGRVR